MGYTIATSYRGSHTIAVEVQQVSRPTPMDSRLTYSSVPRSFVTFVELAAGTKVYASQLVPTVASAELPLAIPLEKPEQRAIAAVLSDMDAEIAALEHRLDKTRAIKQGMMQQLLTGSIRLPIPEDDRE